jgi:hypothetical protein
MKMRSALLIGNGVNRLNSDGPGWQKLISALASKWNLDGFVEALPRKPFTLAFDELTLLARRQQKNRTAVKTEVAELIKKLRPGEYHHKLVTLGIPNILTSNYDHALEIAACGDKGNPVHAKSPKYNLFRRRSCGNIDVWHIHGDADVPRSIVLGYDHYAGTIERMRQYLKRGYRGYRSPFKKGVSDFEDGSEPFSWIDIFLRDDIHIVGLGLDFSEIDIWWLLYYKARLANRKVSVGSTFFYEFSDAKTDDASGRLDVMKGFGVGVRKIAVDRGYPAAWDEVLLEISRSQQANQSVPNQTLDRSGRSGGNQMDC